jgi:hypothetical protein
MGAGGNLTDAQAPGDRAGTPVTQIHELADGKFRTEVRKPDGVWSGPKGPRKKGLSAVLSTEQIDPWHFASRHARLIRNPWATTPLPPLALGIDEFNPVDGSFHKIKGATAGPIFSLPQDWPLG